MSTRPIECLSWEWHMGCMEAARQAGIAAARAAVAERLDWYRQQTSLAAPDEDYANAIDDALAAIDRVGGDSS